MPSVAPHYRTLPPELVTIQEKMREHAADYGLDFFPTIFELVEADELNSIAAYGGFPTRYPHWRFGMEFERLAKGYSYGLQKIYELVINNDPCYAYLLASNEMTDHKLVMAHVYGHCDFFKNNEWFRHTNRKMIDEMANHGNRIRRYMDRFGVTVVENFIDCCLSIEELIDPHSPFIQRAHTQAKYQFRANTDEGEEIQSRRFHAKSYMDAFINPPHALEAELNQRRQTQLQTDSFPSEPMRDVMLFVLEHAPLKAWQLDVLSIIRDEAYYFAPQGMTKIMNEGWATYWHSTIMTRHGIEANDLICYADHCSGTLASSPNRLNPYKLGVELFRDIEDRWNRGCFGAAYDRCDDRRTKETWDRRTGLGRDKIFEVRRVHNDITFVDEFLTLDFCKRHHMFQFGYNDYSGDYEIESREFDAVKQQLLFNLTNHGRPLIYVREGNYKNRGELLLEHRFQGVELKSSYAEDTLKNLYTLWKRPVHLETILDEQRTMISHDGQTSTVEVIEDGTEKTDNS